MKTGKVCAKHPELNGLRQNSGFCAGCAKEYKRTAEQRERRNEYGRQWRRDNPNYDSDRKKKRQQLTEHKKKYILLEWTEKLAA